MFGFNIFFLHPFLYEAPAIFSVVYLGAVVRIRKYANHLVLDDVLKFLNCVVGHKDEKSFREPDGSKLS